MRFLIMSLILTRFTGQSDLAVCTWISSARFRNALESGLLHSKLVSVSTQMIQMATYQEHLDTDDPQMIHFCRSITEGR
jgi:hypothetical protein